MRRPSLSLIAATLPLLAHARPWWGQPVTITIPTSSGISSASESSTSTVTLDDPTATTSVSATSGTPEPSPPPLVKPPGGQGFNTTPTYKAKSEFDTQSLYLGLHQELIELDLFRFGLQNFSAEEFAAAGLDDDDRYLLEFMAEQEVGHATLISNMIDVDSTSSADSVRSHLADIGPTAASPRNCTYSYPFTTVREFIDFSRLVTRYGESGTIGFLGHLDAQDAASLINDAIQTEGRQQMVFRQWEGLFPMPFWFTTSITQSMQWTLLAPYIATCPAETPVVPWTAFPALNVTVSSYPLLLRGGP